jgi:hypothetical protein
MTSNDRMIINNELKRIMKEVAVEVLYQHLPGRTKKNLKSG